MTEQTPIGLNSVPFRIKNPELIPAERYYDQTFFEAEKKNLWPHVWQIACRQEEIATVGDFVNYKLFDESILVTRTAEDRIQAFYNTCQHRGRRFCLPAMAWRLSRLRHLHHRRQRQLQRAHPP